MIKDYLKTFILTAGSWFASIAGIIFLLTILTEARILKYLSNPWVLIPVVSIFLIVVSYHTHLFLIKPLRSMYKEELKAIQVKLEQELTATQAKLGQELKTTQEKLYQSLKAKELADKDSALWKASLIERSSGFPTLINAIEEYEKAKDDALVKYLIEKSHPAKKAAEVVREQTRRRREANFEAKKVRSLIDYYEFIAPFLIELKGDLIEARYDDEVFREYGEEEKHDPVINYLTKEEYRKLSSVERNQLALDRFWKRQKSNRLVGRLYERYIGFLYEEQGYTVEYFGIFKGYEDLGRDLICRNKHEDIVIQCKNWSQFKRIYENHIFQFFGTVFQYKDTYPHRQVRPIFYTTTEVSDVARRFAEQLGIELKERFKFDDTYPCIKCNINLSTKEKIYHLPFDQQYDNTKIVNPGELYCRTVKEAEDAGFRRALRWQGNKDHNDGT